MDSMAIIQSATVNAADLLDMSDSLGMLEVGKPRILSTPLDCRWRISRSCWMSTSS